MIKRILVEGPDGAGKSTLISQLYRDLKIGVVMHFGIYEDPHDAYVDYKASLVGSWTRDITFVYDRMFISEAIYSRVFRNRRSMHVGNYQDLFEDLTKDEYRLIYCMPPMTTTIDSIKMTSEEQYSDDITKHAEVYNAFHLLSNMDPFGVGGFIYDWTKEGSYEELLKYVQ